MVVRKTDSYFAEPGKPAYIVSIYQGRHNRLLTPSHPFAMVQADAWSEAVIFGATYAKMTPGEWTRVETLASEGEHRSYVTAKMDFWTEDGELVRSPLDLMPHESVRRLSETVVDEPIAQETDDDASKKMREKFEYVSKMMKSAPRGSTLADAIAAQSEREINARAKERFEHLFKYGQHDPEQGSLFNPGGTLGGEVRNWLLEKVKVYSYHSAQELKELAHNDMTFKGQLYSDLNPAIDRGLEALRDEGILEYHENEYLPWYRPAKEEQLGLDAFESEPRPCTHCGAMTLGRCTACRKPVCEKCWHISKEYHDARGEPAEFVVGAFETDSSGWDKPLGDTRGLFTFRSWVYRNKKPNADDTLLDASLQEAREQKDLMASEARRRVEALHEAILEEATTPSERPWSDIADVIDWDSMAEREALADQARSRLADIGKEIHEFRESGLISPDEVKELTNTRDIVQRLPNKRKEAFLARISELEKQLTEKKAETPSPQQAQTPAGRQRPVQGYLSQPEVDLLFNTYCSIFTRRTKRECYPTEVTKFEELIETIQKVRPPLKFVQARIQVENLARERATLASAGRIVISRGKARLDYLLDKQLSGGLNPAELDELQAIKEGEPIGPVEEVTYDKPDIEIVATAVPPKYPRKDVPFVIQRIWEMGAAEAEKARLEGLGFTVQIKRVAE